MADQPGWTLAQLGELLQAEVRGPAELILKRPVPAGSNDPHGVTFADSKRYLDKVLLSRVGAVIVSRGTPEIDKPALVCESPRKAYFVLLSLAERQRTFVPGIHEQAIVDPGASVHASASVGALVIVEEDVVIEADARILPFCYIGPGCRIGKGATLMPGAVLVQDVTLGAGAFVHSGAVLGADGFGFVWDGSRQVKIPQVGGVCVGDQVEIGANTAIDRATSGLTVVADDVKIDNLVQIGHNSTIGAHTVIAGQVGVSGSVTIGERAIIGGQAAFADHVSVGNDVALAGRAGVIGDLPDPGQYFGLPVLPVKQAMRILAVQNRLPELLSRIRDLEKEVARLKGN